MIREIAGTLAVLAIFVFFAYIFLIVAEGQAQSTTVETEPVIIRGDPGSWHTLHNPIPTSQFGNPGDVCLAAATGNNNKSEHPGNDIIITGSVNSAIMLDVEATPGKVTPATETLVLGDGVLTFQVRLGSDGVFSAGFLLEVTCNPPTTTTTSSPVVSSTSTPMETGSTTTSIPAPTTTTPPPVGGVPTGGGACADGACDGGAD